MARCIATDETGAPSSTHTDCGCRDCLDANAVEEARTPDDE